LPGDGAGATVVWSTNGRMTMPEIHEEITIERPLQQVFDYLSEPANQTLINSNYARYDTDGPLQKGMRSQGATKVAGRQVEWTAEVTEFEPPRLIRYQSVEAPMAFTIEYQLEDLTNHTTHVTFHQHVDQLGGFFGKLSDPLVTRMYSRDVRGNLAHLKELLEDEG
jgi:uncharacterized membrane protein